MEDVDSKLTRSERFVADLCRRAFLRLWAHPSPIMLDKKNKELCDCLVAFSDDVIIFSVKEIQYKGPSLRDDVEQQSEAEAAKQYEEYKVHLKRWKKKALEDSKGQILGAERYLRRGGRVRTRDGQNLRIPKPDCIRIHRIAVALGAGDNISLGLEGDPESPVLILRETDLAPVLTHLDTVQDLVGFIRWFFDEMKDTRMILQGGGLQDLLPWYLSGDHLNHLDAEDGHPSLMVIEAGTWEAYLQGEDYHELMEFRSDSYRWDEFVNILVDDMLTGGLFEHESQRPLVPHGEQQIALEALLSERRDVRAHLGRAFIEVILPEAKVKARALWPGGENYYVFLLRPHTERHEALKELTARCLVVAAYAAIPKPIIGIALDRSGAGKGWAADIMYLTGGTLSSRQMEFAIFAHTELGFFNRTDWKGFGVPTSR